MRVQTLLNFKNYVIWSLQSAVNQKSQAKGYRHSSESRVFLFTVC